MSRYSVFLYGDGEAFAFVGKSGERIEATADRIVECVKACEGMLDPARDIAFASGTIRALHKETAALRAQRDELAAALRRREIATCVALGVVAAYALGWVLS